MSVAPKTAFVGERWHRLKLLYERCICLDANLWTSELARECEDPELRQEVLRLLAKSESAAQFLETPILRLGFSPADRGDVMRPGDVVAGRFEIEAGIGAGGMGEVYRAKDRQLLRIVALKVLRFRYQTLEANGDPLLQEARAASALNHPNIAQVYEVGRYCDATFIAMEYVEGRSLRDILRNGPLNIDDAVRYAAEIASALEEAHAAGIVHRDVKPGNVRVTSKGSVKLIDFGIAKKRGTEHSCVIASDETRSGWISGTAGYMSPEQALGEDADHRSDLFSLGVVLYEMLSGRQPFRGSVLAETTDKILHHEPEPPAALSGAHLLDRIVGRCLRKQKDERCLPRSFGRTFCVSAMKNRACGAGWDGGHAAFC